MTNEQLIAIEMKPLEGCAAVLVSFNRPFTHVEMNAMHRALNEHLIPHDNEPGACGIKCTHCNGNGTKLQVFDAELFDGWSPEDEPCETCNGAGRITTVEQYLKTLPADWHQDSSVETWFPMLNEEVERLRRAEKSCMEHHISQGASRDASSGEG